jgi:hypothetical protein
VNQTNRNVRPDSQVQATIEALARELDLPFEQVASVYRRQVAALESGARIKNFVPILVSQRVRQELRRQHGSH